MIFQHHPDGWVYVRGESKTYCDTHENFAADFGENYPGLPNGYICRIYDQGKRHVLSDGMNETVQEIPWSDGDAYIAALDTLIANQIARTTGKVTITVTDNSGTVIEGATVTEGNSSLTTDSNGQVTFSGLNAGTYTFTAAKTGYTSASASATTVIGSTVTATITISTTS